MAASATCPAAKPPTTHMLRRLRARGRRRLVHGKAGAHSAWTQGTAQSLPRTTRRGSGFRAKFRFSQSRLPRLELLTDAPLPCHLPLATSAHEMINSIRKAFSNARHDESPRGRHMKTKHSTQQQSESQHSQSGVGEPSLARGAQSETAKREEYNISACERDIPQSVGRDCEAIIGRRG